MRWTIPLIFLGLAACDAPFEEVWPSRQLSYETDGRVWDVRAQFDPLERGWFVRVGERTGKLALQDRNSVHELIANQVRSDICPDDTVYQKPGNVITGFGAPRERYLPDLGQWQLVVVCA